MVANTKRIEESAIHALKGVLLRCPTLAAYISENDKTPSWDGQIFVYGSADQKKSDGILVVPVQVKGTASKLSAIRCGAYLLLDDNESAQKCFDEMPTAQQKEFLKFPICRFGNLKMTNDAQLIGNV